MTPLQQCREAKGLELTDLRRETGLAVGRLEQIEEGRGRPITRDEARKIARALEVRFENFLPMSFASCSDLDVDEDEILKDA